MNDNAIQPQSEYSQLSFMDDYAKAVDLRTCPHRTLHTSFWQISPNNCVKNSCNTRVFLRIFALFSAKLCSKIRTQFLCGQVLNTKIIISAQMDQQNLLEACTRLKEMRDSKLYTVLGYEDFEEYAEKEVGLKRRQAYRYISIIENLPESFVSPGAHLGASKLYLLSTLSEEERAEVTESVDLENVTKRELEKKVKEIKTLRIDLEKASEDNELLSERLAGLESENEQKLKDNEQLRTELDSTARTNAELSKRLDELERRPVEVAVQTNQEEVDELRQAMEKEKKDIHEQYRAQIEELTVEYEAKLSEAERTAATEVVADVKETFKMYYTAAYNSFGSLIKFVGEQDGSHKDIFIEKIIQLADSLKESAKNVR